MTSILDHQTAQHRLSFRNRHQGYRCGFHAPLVKPLFYSSASSSAARAAGRLWGVGFPLPSAKSRMVLRRKTTRKSPKTTSKPPPPISSRLQPHTMVGAFYPLSPFSGGKSRGGDPDPRSQASLRRLRYRLRWLGASQCPGTSACPGAPVASMRDDVTTPCARPGVKHGETQRHRWRFSQMGAKPREVSNCHLNISGHQTHQGFMIQPMKKFQDLPPPPISGHPT